MAKKKQKSKIGQLSDKLDSWPWPVKAVFAVVCGALAVYILFFLVPEGLTSSIENSDAKEASKEESKEGGRPQDQSQEEAKEGTIQGTETSSAGSNTGNTYIFVLGGEEEEEEPSPASLALAQEVREDIRKVEESLARHGNEQKEEILSRLERLERRLKREIGDLSSQIQTASQTSLSESKLTEIKVRLEVLGKELNELRGFYQETQSDVIQNLFRIIEEKGKNEMPNGSSVIQEGKTREKEREVKESNEDEVSQCSECPECSGKQRKEEEEKDGGVEECFLRLPPPGPDDRRENLSISHTDFDETVRLKQIPVREIEPGHFIFFVNGEWTSWPWPELEVRFEP